MNVENEKEWFLERLQEAVDLDYRAGVFRTLTTGLKIYGVRTPHRREIARDWRRARGDVVFDDLLPVVEMLWNGDSQEERAMAMELLNQYPHHIPSLTWDHFERWRFQVDNWVLADGLGSTVLGPWLAASPDDRLDYLWYLIETEHTWSRRGALVATTPINDGRADSTLPDMTLELIERVKEERDPMITKAVSWVLRVLIKKHADRVSDYLEKNRDVLAAHVVREVTNKLRTGLKSGKGKRE
jgi:3-methyladenine DNA glycosylase AlkD